MVQRIGRLVVAVAVVVGASITPGLVAGAALPPTAVPDAFGTFADSGELFLNGAAGVLANDVPGSPGDPLSARLVDAPDHGALALFPDGGFAYRSHLGFEGDDTFTYVAVGSDGTASAPTTVTVTTDLFDDRQPTQVQLGRSRLSLNPLGLRLEALVSTLDGAPHGSRVLFFLGDALLCEGRPAIFLGQARWSFCTVDLLRALPILLGAPVTVEFRGSFQLAHSSATGPMPLDLGPAPI